MDDLVIQRHDFDAAKAQLKEFLNDVPTSIELLEVPTSGGFLWLFDHNVTGEELNELTKQIGRLFINSNQEVIKTIKEFDNIYKAFEALDKDYIQYILTSIKATEEVSHRAREIAEETAKNSSDISRSMEVQKETIRVLQQFKEKLDKYEHMLNIDEIWDDSQKLKRDIKYIESRLSVQMAVINMLEQFKEKLDKYRHMLDIDEIWDDSQKLKKDIQSVDCRLSAHNDEISVLEQFKETLDTYEHLQNIDEIWDDSQKSKKDIQSVNSRLLEHMDAISALEQFKEMLIAYEHLQNIDEIWDDSQKLKKDMQSVDSRLSAHNDEISALEKFKETLDTYEHLQNIDEIWGDCQVLKNDNQTINDTVEIHQTEIMDLRSNNKHYEEEINRLHKHTRIAYALAGSSLVAVLVSVILNIIGIL